MVPLSLRGVWVCAPPRSGTSMVSGLFAQHGVFFGNCVEPHPNNPKGFFENHRLKRWAREEEPWPEPWPDGWFDRLALEAGRMGVEWTGLWGAKTQPKEWGKMRTTEPRVVVFCIRPLGDVRLSGDRLRWARPPTEEIIQDALRWMGRVREGATCPVVEVDTDGMVRERDYSTILPAFDALGVEFDPAIADEWVEPRFWCRT